MCRSDFGAAYLENAIYVVGGENKSHSQTDFLTAVEK